jgi:hypothetical protein
MTIFSLVADAFEFRIRTRAEGMFSRLAHDLELAAEPSSATFESSGQEWTGTLRFAATALSVVGVVRGETVDRSVLSAKDRQEIERRLSEEIVTKEVVVEASGTDRRSGALRVRIGSAEQRVAVALRVDERGERLYVTGRGEASLRALGVREVKGPLGAFKIADRIELLVDAVLAPAG